MYNTPKIIQVFRILRDHTEILLRIDSADGVGKGFIPRQYFHVLSSDSPRNHQQLFSGLYTSRYSVPDYANIIHFVVKRSLYNK